MTGQLLLHIGMHETGAGAVQAALAGFDDGRTRMARLGPANHSVPMSTVFCAHPERYHVWVRQGLDAGAIAARQDSYRGRLQAELALGRARVVISAEELALLDPASVGRMADWLRPRAGGVAVIAWLRPVAEFAAAGFAQMVRAGLAKPLLPRPRYRDRFAPYLATFGHEAVALRPHAPDDPVADFCAALGIPCPPHTARPADAALSADALRLIWAFNASGMASAGNLSRLTARSRLIRHLAGRHPGALALPPAALSSAFDPADRDWAEAVAGFALHHGPAPRPATAEAGAAILLDWLAAHHPAALDRLDEDLEIIRTRTRPRATTGEKVAALYQALLDEVEAEQALAPVFRARSRATQNGARDRIDLTGP